MIPPIPTNIHICTFVFYFLTTLYVPVFMSFVDLISDLEYTAREDVHLQNLITEYWLLVMAKKVSRITGS